MILRGNRAQKALLHIAENLPDFSTLTIWANHLDNDERPQNIAWTDGRSVFYGPMFDELSHNEKRGVILHEISHIAFNHILRAKKLKKSLGQKYNHLVFGIAADSLINSWIREMHIPGVTLPTSGIFFENVKFALDDVENVADFLQKYDVERLYMALLKKAEDMANQGQSQKEKGDQDSKSAPGGGTDGQSGDSEKGAGENSPNAEKSPDANDGQIPPEDAIEKVLRKIFGKRLDNPSDIDIDSDPDAANPQHPDAGKSDEEIEREWTHRMNHAAQTGKMAGKGMGNIPFKIADIRETRTPWNIILRRCLNKTFQEWENYNPAWPSNIWVSLAGHAHITGAPVPPFEGRFMRQHRLRPKIIVGMDVSGSISNDDLVLFANEIATISGKMGIDIHLAVFDDGIQSEMVLRPDEAKEQIKKTVFTGRGGTSYYDLFKRAEEIKATCMIVLTDLYATIPDEAPRRCKVIWACVPNSANTVTPYGTRIDITH